MTRSEQQDAELVKYLDEVGETQDSDLCCGFLDGWDKADETFVDFVCDRLEYYLTFDVAEFDEGVTIDSFVDKIRKAIIDRK